MVPPLTRGWTCDRRWTETVRVGCLLLPDLPLAAELRAHRELAGLPCAVAAGRASHAELISISPEARRQGVRRGIAVSHARMLCSDLQVRVASPALWQAAREALLDAALSCSPRAELAPEASGVFAVEAAVHLDASGSERLFHSEAGLASALCARTEALQLPANVAIASSRDVSRLLARELPHSGGHSRVLGAGEEAAFLAPLPIDLLDAEDSLAQALTRFGVQTLRDLLALPAQSLAARLGPEILEWMERLRGTREEAPLASPEERRLVEAIDLDFAVDRLQPLLFVIQGLLSRLLARLEARQLGCGAFSIVLDLADGECDTRHIGVAAPTRDLRVLVGLAGRALEAHSLRAPVEALRIETEGSLVGFDQLDLFRPAGPAPALLDETLAALENLCGDQRVGSPAVADTHYPGAFGIRAFRASSAEPASEVRDASVGYLASRALRPPVPARVQLRGNRPVWVESPVIQGDVLHCAGPWRTTGGWWAPEERFAFDCYDVQTSDGGVARLRFDHVRRCWQIDALYD